jgi:hypothetical protein
MIPLSRCAGDELAVVTYRKLCGGMNIDFANGDKQLPREMTFVISSTLPLVEPQDIRFLLRAGNTEVAVAVAHNGTFTVPVSKQLFDTAAVLESNQPKGTIKIRVSPIEDLQDMSAPLADHLDNGRISYGKLSQLAIDAREKLIKRLEQQSGGKSTSVEVDSRNGRWVLVLVASEEPEVAEAGIVASALRLGDGPLRRGLRTAWGPTSPIVKKSPGVFIIPYSDILRKEDPMIELSPRSAWMCTLVIVPDQAK